MAVFALAFVAVATSAVPRNAAAALSREHEAGHRQMSLAKLQEQHQQLELLQREKDALLEIIVHDMRSPVGAALLSLEYLALELKKHPSQASLLEATDDALGTLNSLSGMISQILDMSKLESGRLTLRLDFAELRPILEATVRDSAPRARARSIALTSMPQEGSQSGRRGSAPISARSGSPDHACASPHPRRGPHPARRLRRGGRDPRVDPQHRPSHPQPRAPAHVRQIPAGTRVSPSASRPGAWASTSAAWSPPPTKERSPWKMSTAGQRPS
jgi:signal transduction histidine kinase